MIGWRRVLAWGAVAAVACLLRFHGLADRPMHADEAILADRFGSLLEGRGLQYDPAGYHGPALAWFTLLPARAAGFREYASLNETVLRVVPALAGLALVFVPLLIFKGRVAWLAAALTAVSPAMVWWSRDYIPEILLALWIGLLMAAAYRYGQRPRLLTACLAGACAGLAWATKETAAIAFVCLFGAALVTRRNLKPLTLTHAAAGLGTAIAVALVLFTPAAFIDSFRSLVFYVRQAGGGLHRHPPGFYLGLIGSWRAEPLLFALAVFGAVLARTPFARFLCVYSGLMLAFYAFVPYKTPWCLLQFWQPMLLLAGVAAARLPRLAGAAIVALAIWNSWTGNAYAYAETRPDVFTVRDRVAALASAHGPGFRMQVFSRENLWPLPWYLRNLKSVEWSRGVPEDRAAAPVILLSPDMEPATSRLLYEIRPPGERELYVSYFDRPIQLRPGVELRGYAAKSLADRIR